MDEKVIQEIKEVTENLFSKAGFPVEASVKASFDEGQESIVCNIQTNEDSNFLIGQYGVNLQAFQHLFRLIVKKKSNDNSKFILDINSYRKQKNDSVMEQARDAAEQAVSEKRAIILRPMSAYERRLVHMELSSNEKVMTESIGEGEDRKVVVKPSSEIK